jgi:hypothetical protein
LQNELGQPPNRAQNPRPGRIGLDFRSETGFCTFKSVRPLRKKSGMRKHAHAQPPGGAMHWGSREVDKGTIPGLGRALFRVLWENHFFGGSGLGLIPGRFGPIPTELDSPAHTSALPTRSDRCVQWRTCAHHLCAEPGKARRTKAGNGQKRPKTAQHSEKGQNRRSGRSVAGDSN